MTWLEMAEHLANAAQQALMEGDQVAALELSVEARKCLQIAKNLQRADEAQSDLRKGAADA